MCYLMYNCMSDVKVQHACVISCIRLISLFLAELAFNGILKLAQLSLAQLSSAQLSSAQLSSAQLSSAFSRGGEVAERGLWLPEPEMPRTPFSYFIT